MASRVRKHLNHKLLGILFCRLVHNRYIMIIIETLILFFFFRKTRNGLLLVMIPTLYGRCRTIQYNIHHANSKDYRNSVYYPRTLRPARIDFARVSKSKNKIHGSAGTLKVVIRVGI